MERKVLCDLNITQERREESPLLYYTPNKINSQHDQGSTTVQVQGEGQEIILLPGDKEANKENGQPAEDVEKKVAEKGPRKSVLQLFDPLCDRSVTQDFSSPTATAVTEAFEPQQEETFEDACETKESFAKYNTPLQDSVEYKRANNLYKPSSLNETLILEKSNRVCTAKQETGKLLDITFDQIGCVQSSIVLTENEEVKACDIMKQNEDISETIREDAEFLELEAQITQMEEDSNMLNHEHDIASNEQNNSDKEIFKSEIGEKEIPQTNTTFEISQTLEEKQTEDKGIVNAKEFDSNENQYHEIALNLNNDQETAQKLDIVGKPTEKCVINCEEVIVLNESELASKESSEKSIDEVIVLDDTNDPINESVAQEITLNTISEDEVSKCNETFERSKISDTSNTTNENEVSKSNQTFERPEIKGLEIKPVSEFTEKSEPKDSISGCEKSNPREISEENKNVACTENINEHNSSVLEQDLSIINKQKMGSSREVPQKLETPPSEQQLIKDKTLKDIRNVSENSSESDKLAKLETEQNEKTLDNLETITPKKLEEENSEQKVNKNSTDSADHSNVDNLIPNCPVDNTDFLKMNTTSESQSTYVEETLDEIRKLSINPEPEPNKDIQNEQLVNSPVDEKKSDPQKIGSKNKEPNLLADKKLKLQSELSKLRLELNEAQQVNANLQLEIRKKDEVILKGEAEVLQTEQTYKKQIEQLEGQLKNFKGPDENADLLFKIEDSVTNEEKLNNELNKKNAEILGFQRIMEEYELKLQLNAQYLQKLKVEYDAATRHLANTELAFSDVHEKYERSKAVLDVYRNNEDTLKRYLEVNGLRLKTAEEKYDALKAYCTDVQKKYAEDLHKMRQKYSVELEKFRAVTKRLEIKCSSLQTSLDQKTQECVELSALCDELTGKQM